jgi:hypothetical protein
MLFGFCMPTYYDPYRGSPGLCAVAETFSWPSIAAQSNSYGFGFGWGASSWMGLTGGFSFFPGSVFGGSCWSVPGGYCCPWYGPMGIGWYTDDRRMPNGYYPPVTLGPLSAVGNAPSSGSGNASYAAPAKGPGYASDSAAAAPSFAPTLTAPAEGEGKAGEAAAPIAEAEGKAGAAAAKKPKKPKKAKAPPADLTPPAPPTPPSTGAVKQVGPKVTTKY